MTGPEASKMRQDIADREDILNRYTWKEDHWFDMQEDKKIGDNNDLAKEMQILDPRFYDIASTTGGESNEVSFVKKPFTLDELAKEGIDRSLFQGSGEDAAEKIKSYLPENYDIVTGKSMTFSGRKGESIFDTSDNYFEIIDTDNGNVIGKFKTLYIDDPTKAQKQLQDFQKQMKDILGFMPKPGLQ